MSSRAAVVRANYGRPHHRSSSPPATAARARSIGGMGEHKFEDIEVYEAGELVETRTVWAYFGDPDRDDLGTAVDEQTDRDMAELAIARAQATGRPVAVCGFAASGRARVHDLLVDDVGELLLHDLGCVPVAPSRPLGA